MWLHDLFKRDNVDIPEWLDDNYLDDEWGNSTYLKGENLHKWELTTPLGFSNITLEDNVYIFSSYDENNDLIFEQIITPEYQSIT